MGDCTWAVLSHPAKEAVKARGTSSVRGVEPELQRHVDTVVRVTEVGGVVQACYDLLTRRVLG